MPPNFFVPQIMIYFFVFSLGFVFALFVISINDLLKKAASECIDKYDFEIKENTIYKMYPCPAGWRTLKELPNVCWVVKEDDSLVIKTESFGDMEQIVLILNSTTQNAPISSKSDR